MQTSFRSTRQSARFRDFFPEVIIFKLESTFSRSAFIPRLLMRCYRPCEQYCRRIVTISILFIYFIAQERIMLEFRISRFFGNSNFVICFSFIGCKEERKVCKQSFGIIITSNTKFPAVKKKTFAELCNIRLLIFPIYEIVDPFAIFLVDSFFLGFFS